MEIRCVLDIVKVQQSCLDTGSSRNKEWKISVVKIKSSVNSDKWQHITWVKRELKKLTKVYQS